MKRREFLAAALSAPALFGKNRIDFSRISAVTDEIASSPQGSIEFAQKYGLKWLELRAVPGSRRGYYTLEGEELREAARLFASNGIRISFLNTPLLKFARPGSPYVSRRPETPEDREKRLKNDANKFENRIAELEKALRAAEAFDVDKVRVFTFLRTTEPEREFQQAAEIIDGMAKVAAKAGVKLLVENESSCNVATSAELANFFKLGPAGNVGINWDPINGLHGKEIPFPDGYALLPKKRIWNVQIKGKSVTEDKERLDWPAIFRALERDGYKGKVGLETHIFDGRMIEHSHTCIQEIARLVGRVS